jgi:hypothetical protein
MAKREAGLRTAFRLIYTPFPEFIHSFIQAAITCKAYHLACKKILIQETHVRRTFSF